ncbi:hypothetical protein GFY24_37675 [Nocardia sp. SYP-A9097]|uniref:hypothetical protein n=1 Tax=Nocardia sp. SYP-A9097 TaxID=2663237 RepID=UPI00129BB576|nr:hypothetical protein [Nocardia sp. SYP-A9097]MRH93088.1 hypothetical protein [Nocardia sp. SYP-A9097]
MAPKNAKDPAWLAEWHARWERVRAERDAWRHRPIETEPGIMPDSAALQEVPLLESTTTSNICATWYRDNPEFYSAAAEVVRKAQRDIRVTYLRRHPPTMFTSPASAAYFAAILDWARECDAGERSARRVIAVPPTGIGPEPAMLGWLRRHHDETEGLLNYEASVFEWGATADGVNMALLDDDVAFLAFSGGSRQKLNGFSVADPTFVEYFIRYFEQLWSASRPLEAYLRDRDG